MSAAVLGLDAQALRLGWALAHLDDGAPIACGCLPLGFLGRYSPTVRESLGLIEDEATVLGCQITLVYCEAPYVGVGRQTAIRHAMAVGEVRQAVNQRWPEMACEMIAPGSWKKAAGLPGNATKRQIAAHARALGWQPILPDDKRVDVQDALDAALIALAGARVNAQNFASS